MGGQTNRGHQDRAEAVTWHTDRAASVPWAWRSPQRAVMMAQLTKLSREKVHGAFDLPPCPWMGANRALWGGGGVCLPWPPWRLRGAFFSSSSGSGLCQDVFILDSLVFFQGVEAMALPLLE